MFTTDRAAHWIVTLLLLVILLLIGVLLYVLFVPTSIIVSEKNESMSEVVPTKKPPSPFLGSEESVMFEVGTTSKEVVLLPVEKVLFEYVEVVNSCGPHFEGECLRARSGPGFEYEVQGRLRDGMVLKVGGKVERDGAWWYKIVFDEWLRYPERLKGDWYVAAEYVKIVMDEGVKTIGKDLYATTTKKTITVNRSEQKLYAFEGDELFLEVDISTGLELTPTPRGTFTIFKKTPSRYMQGPLPYLAQQKYYDLPGVPWNLYFTEEGAVIHGAYWHNSFGSRYSSGCVNVDPAIAYALYNWAELGTTVIVKD